MTDLIPPRDRQAKHMRSSETLSVREQLTITWCHVCQEDTIPADAGWCFFCETQLIGERKPYHYGPGVGYKTQEERDEARRLAWLFSKRRARGARRPA